MRICWVIDRFSLNEANTYSHTVKLIESISSQGIKVYVVAHECDILHKQLPSNLSIIKVNKSRLSPLVDIPRLILVIIRTVRQFNIDLIFGYIIGKILFSSALAGKLTNRKILLWHCGQPTYNLQSCDSRGVFIIRWLINIILDILKEWMLKFSLRTANIMITGTNDMAQFYENYVGRSKSSISVISNSVDTLLFRKIDKEYSRKKLGFHPSDFILIYVGRFSEQKGTPLLLQSLPLIKENIPSLKVLLIGGHPTSREKERERIIELRTQLQELGISDCVITTGSVPNTNLPLYLSASDVFILPSPREGFPRALIEAMACGLPVIVGPDAGLDEIIQGSGIVLSSLKPQDIANGIIKLANDSALRLTLSKKARDEAVRKYSLNVSVRKYIHLFRKVAASGEI